MAASRQYNRRKRIGSAGAISSINASAAAAWHQHGINGIIRHSAASGGAIIISIKAAALHMLALAAASSVT